MEKLIKKYSPFVLVAVISFILVVYVNDYDPLYLLTKKIGTPIQDDFASSGVVIDKNYSNDLSQLPQLYIQTDKLSGWIAVSDETYKKFVVGDKVSLHLPMKRFGAYHIVDSKKETELKIGGPVDENGWTHYE